MFRRTTGVLSAVIVLMAAMVWCAHWRSHATSVECQPFGILLRAVVFGDSVFLTYRSGAIDNTNYTLHVDWAEDELPWMRFELGEYARRSGRHFHARLSVRWAMLAVFVFGAYSAAALILNPVRRWRRVRRGACPWCGYDLRGAPSEVCPECGRSPPSSTSDISMERRIPGVRQA